MDDVHARIYDRASRQRGLLSRSDLQALEVSRHQRTRLIRIGAIAPAGQRTFLVGGLPPDPLRLVLLGCMETGGIASHRTAAALHGLRSFKIVDPPEVMVHRSQANYRSGAAVVHATTWLPDDDRVAVHGIPVTGLPRTLLSLAGLVPRLREELVRGAVEEAIRTGAASDAWLWWRLEKLRCRGRRGVAVMEAILDRRRDGEMTESWLEREFLRILAAAGVELPQCQARIEVDGSFVARVDFVYSGTPILIEVTGAVAHASAAQRAGDARRRNVLGLLRPILLEFTYDQVVYEPALVVAQVLAALTRVGHPSLVRRAS